MKKISVLALILAVLMLAMVVPASAEKYTLDSTKTDVLLGLSGDKVSVYSPKTEISSDAQLNRLTDGVYAIDLASSDGKDTEDLFFNKAFVENKTAPQEGKDPASYKTDDPEVFKYTLAGRKYVAYFQFDLPAAKNVDSFSAFFCSDNVAADGHAAKNLIDGEFDILVSKDNGTTWEVAWQSTRLTKAPEDAYTATSAADDAVLVDDGKTAHPRLTYWKLEGQFSKTFEGVTNVAYAVSRIKRNGTTTVDEQVYLVAAPQYYPGRMSELAVYEAPAAPIPSGGEDPAPSTGDNFAVFAMVAAVVLTAGAVLVVRKKED